MRLGKNLLAVSIGVTIVAAACGSSSKSGGATSTSAAGTTTAAVTTTAAPGTTAVGATTTTTIPKRGDADLVIWADDTRAPVLKPIADAFGAKEGIKVVVQQVAFDQIRSQLSIVGPTGEGPDVIVGAHDWLGELVTSGAIQPVDIGNPALYQKVAVQGFTYSGKVYGLPYAVENIALIRNTDLVPNALATWEEVEKAALDLKAAGKVDLPIAVQQGPADPYHNEPLFTGAGGYIFKQNADGTYDAKDLGIDSAGGLNAATMFAKWAKEGLISSDVTYDIMIDKFGSGKAPFAITGPWATSDKTKGFKAKGIKYSVDPFPTLAGKQAQPFVGVQGFMVSNFTKKAALAKTFVTDYLGTEATQLALYKVGGRPPALLSALAKVSDDIDVTGFGKAGANGQPLPAIPQMSAVWDAFKNAYTLVLTGKGDPQQAFKDAAAAIRTKIAG